MTKLTNPVAYFYDSDGQLLDGGFIYVGVANADPQTQPIQLYWDVALTIAAAQPLRTIAGKVVNGANPADVFFVPQDSSIRINDINGVQVAYEPTTYLNVNSYQPLDADLTAIANQGTTAYGVSLLLFPNQAALQTAAGTNGALQKTGGTMTGAITRQGAGNYAYGDTGLSPVIYAPQPVGSAAPTSPPPGSLWGNY